MPAPRDLEQAFEQARQLKAQKLAIRNKQILRLISEGHSNCEIAKLAHCDYRVVVGVREGQ